MYERVQRPAVVVKKLETIVSHLISERGLESLASTVQVGLDNGQDLLKMTLTVKDSDNLPKSHKKMKYEEGYCPPSNLLSSVKRLLIIGAVQAPETYFNMRSLMKK